VICSPMNEEELRNMMYTAQLPEQESPVVIRYPRGEGVMSDWRKPFTKMQFGKGRKIRDGRDVAILSFGHPGNFVTEACRQLMNDGLEPAHYDIRFVKPLDKELLHEVFSRFDKVITVEDGAVRGGFGSAILEFMSEYNYKADVKILGIPDHLVEHGKPAELHRECGYDAAGIASAVREMMSSQVTVSNA
jgi:1-deoxy-D-xylulose-5-phosphate synthase